MHLRAKVRGGLRQCPCHRPSRHVSTLIFEDVSGINVRELRKTPTHVVAIQPARLEAEFTQSFVAVEQRFEIWTGLQAERPDLVVEVCARPPVELLPEFNSPGHHLRIHRLASVLVSNRAGLVGRRRPHVRGAELFEQRHALAGPAEPVGRGAAHHARANDHYVIHARDLLSEIPPLPMLRGPGSE